MSTAVSRITVLAGEKFACIKIAGRGDFTNSVEFSLLVRELRAAGYQYFVLDLGECALLDSTFLGVLAMLALQLSETNQDQCEQGLELLNANARITESLECLGVIQLFKLRNGALETPEALEARQHTPAKGNKEETTRACLEAHRTLMEINSANVARFKDVTQFLAEDLKRLKAKEPQRQ